MRKLYSIVAMTAMFLGSVCANAQEKKDPKCNLPEENQVLTSDQFHMRLFKTWDFLAKKVNGADIASPLTFGANDTSMPACDGYKPQPITSAGMKGWCMGIGNIELNDDKGLYNNKNGIRYVILNGIKAGQIIVIEHSKASEKLSERVYAEDGTYTDIKENDYSVNACRIQKASPDGKYPAWTVSYLENQNTEDKNVVYEITDSIHAEQAKNPVITPREDGEGNDTTYNDNFRYFRAKIDGPLYIAMGKTAAFQGVQIWIDANAQESVSVPTYELTSVNGQQREFVCVCGESTLGSDCKILYGYPEEEGYVGPDFEYDESIVVSSNDDYNGDGIVTIECLTKSSTGLTSDVVRFEVDVKDIVLNAPTLTLVGFDGKSRSYQIEWTNNTLCGEEVKFLATGDDEEVYIEDAKIGTVLNVSKNAKVTVSSTGYTENTTEIDVDYAGVEIARKNILAEGVAHDVDFTKPTQEQIDLIQGKAIESVYIEDASGNKTYYTEEEYKIGEANDGTSLAGDDVKVTYKKSGWYAWDGSRKRASLYVDTLYVVNEETNDTTVQYRYAEDQAHLLPAGVTLECGPSSAGVSQVMTYLGNNDLGITCMSAPTLTFDRSVLKAGEIVSITIGAGGGSNYLAVGANGEMTMTLVYIAPTTEPLKVTLPRPATNFCHILAFDYYTPETLPEDTYDPVAVESISNNVVAPVVIYNVSGAKTNGLQKGINIIKMSDGSIKKVAVK